MPFRLPIIFRLQTVPDKDQNKPLAYHHVLQLTVPLVQKLNYLYYVSENDKEYLFPLLNLRKFTAIRDMPPKALCTVLYAKHIRLRPAQATYRNCRKFQRLAKDVKCTRNSRGSSGQCFPTNASLFLMLQLMLCLSPANPCSTQFVVKHSSCMRLSSQSRTRTSSGKLLCQSIG